MKMINLGEKSKCCEPASPEKTDAVHYPSLYLHGVNLPLGEHSGMIKYRVVGCRAPTNGKESCEIEVLSIEEPKSSNGSLADSLNKIEGMKAKAGKK